MKKDERFKSFKGWAAEYFASSVSPKDIDAIVKYIREQEVHHKVVSENEEFESLYSQAGLDFSFLDMK